MTATTYPPVIQERRPLLPPTRTVGDIGGLIGGVLRVLWRHWPALLTVTLLESEVHTLLGQAAFKVSDVKYTDGVLGLLVVALQPLSFLAALAVMLRIVRPSLPWVSAQSPRRATMRDRLIAVRSNLDSILVPFLVVYNLYGWLRDDYLNYSRRVLNADIAEIFSHIGEDFDRDYTFLNAKVIAVLAVVTLAFRWLTLRLLRSGRLPWLSLVSGYFEVLWLIVVVSFVGTVVYAAKDWLFDRQVFGWVGDWWHTALSHLGPLAGPGRATSDWLQEQLDRADILLVAPAALLAVGAVVYGRALVSATDPRLPVPAGPGPGGIRRVRWWMGSIPERYALLWQSIRVLLRGGLTVMLLGCLTVAAARASEWWLWELERFLIGPDGTRWGWLTVYPVLGEVNYAIANVLMVCALAVIVERVMRREFGQPDERAAPPEPTTEPETAPAD